MTVPMRRPVLRLVAVLILASLAAAAAAQDPRTTAAQSAARDWLAYVDRGDAQGAWNSAGKKFQAASTPERWADDLKKAKVLLGKVQQRTVGPARFQKRIPGMPDGEYAQILFRTVFTSKPDGSEQLSLEREADGQWRVIGYFPR
jgi:Protein of unknown function (DUF4019)